MTDKEPEIAFPYKAPSEEVKEKYAHIFNIENPLKTRFLKLLFDKIIGTSFLLAASPILLLLKIAYVVEGLLDRSAKGDLIYYYDASSAGRTIRKYKVRVIKKECVDTANYDEHDWHAYQNEWNPECRTVVGAFVKKFYLDELPQFINVLQGRMSIVGPRPHAVAHNEEYRPLIKGYMMRHKVNPGITGLAQVLGYRGETSTVDAMEKRVECDLDYLRNWSLALDLRIMIRTLRVVLNDKMAF